MRRKSGEPYILHPLAVAQCGGRNWLGTTSIVAALLREWWRTRHGNFGYQAGFG
jgi:(p)ppGpp synthase/HD superfamily hydrolase